MENIEYFDCYKCDAKNSLSVKMEKNFWDTYGGGVSVRCTKCGALHLLIGDEDQDGNAYVDIELEGEL